MLALTLYMHVSCHDVQELPLSSDTSWTEIPTRTDICMKTTHISNTHRFLLESSEEMKESPCFVFREKLLTILL